MNSIVLFLIAIGLFLIAGRIYPRYISRVYDEDDRRPTPAVTMRDGRDYVESKPSVVFAHHYATIAGVAPIVGPILALLYGYLPAWCWVVFGGIFFGAVHDFTALFTSLRERGKSIAEIARKSLGNTGFLLFILFLLVMIILVTSAFLNLAAISLTSMYPLEKLQLPPDQTLLKTTVDNNGVVQGKIGGIASSSVIFITCCAPLLGYLIYNRRLKTVKAFLLAAEICVVSVLLGFRYPVTISNNVWMIIISIYTLLAAGIPVWFILQPRDFINVQVLYGGLGLLAVAVVINGFNGIHFQIPAFNILEGTAILGAMWPILFITIGCGAISGFHSMVASGTTVKQIAKESQAKMGYYAMLLESTLSVLVIVAAASMLGMHDYKAIVYPGQGGASNPIFAFSLACGLLFWKSVGLPIAIGCVLGILVVEGFIVTTLDTAVRMNRYLFEELWDIVFHGSAPALLRHYWFNSALSAALMFLFAYTNAIGKLWLIFGTANQLVAALALIAISLWLIQKGKSFLFTFLPMIFMVATTMNALRILLGRFIKSKNYLLATTDILLLCLAIGVLGLALRAFLRRPLARPSKAEDIAVSPK
jgi:carbon starvation protein